MDLQQAFDEGFDALKGYVDRSFAAFEQRLDSMAAKLAAIPAPEVDENDLDAVMADVESLRKAVAEIPKPLSRADLEEIARSAVNLATASVPTDASTRKLIADEISALPVPENGKDADPEQIAALVKTEAERILSGWERPQDGKSVSVEDVAPLIAQSVQKAVAAIPAAKDGCGIKDLLIDRAGALVATMDDGRVKELGPVVGRDGKDADMPAIERSISEKIAAIPKPKDGIDGLGFEDMTVGVESERTVVMQWCKGDEVKEARIDIPVMIYRGVFREGQPYKQGDTVTWGGSLWHCDVDTKDKPDGAQRCWTLAAKKGRDGKDGIVKPAKAP